MSWSRTTVWSARIIVGQGIARHVRAMSSPFPPPVGTLHIPTSWLCIIFPQFCWYCSSVIPVSEWGVILSGPMCWYLLGCLSSFITRGSLCFWQVSSSNPSRGLAMRFLARLYFLYTPSHMLASWLGST